MRHMSEELHSDVLCVAEARRTVYYLTVGYEEVYSRRGPGSLYKTSGRRDEEEAPALVLAANEMLSSLWLSPSSALAKPGQNSRQSLATNEGLSAMWASPTGLIGGGSVDGHVATTAAVRGQAVPGDVVYKSRFTGIQ